MKIVLAILGVVIVGVLILGFLFVSVADGAEIYCAQSAGHFHYLDDKFFIEQTNAFTRRLEPLTGRELWRIEYAARHAFVSTIGNQLTVRTNNGTSGRFE